MCDYYLYFTHYNAHMLGLVCCTLKKFVLLFRQFQYVSEMNNGDDKKLDCSNTAVDIGAVELMNQVNHNLHI